MAAEHFNSKAREALIDLIAEHLHGTYHCMRAWEAWHVGTMSARDFDPVDESDTPTELADAIIAKVLPAFELALEALELVEQEPRRKDVAVLDAQDLKLISMAAKALRGAQAEGAAP